ncbi:hypothetical protein NA23_09635 [Fervidobacterium islandicum]|uniref:Uncharacterized protein n=1 Tax=Fervidobacterium islandicum TaxID=2423 RepID=A0AAI8CM46_FERIS|nr:hypothetical protein [Fervidobacterium islandicum]AMW33467.1 hypothetical protein NA23_09635 [Fervidobacterium islandicum]
MKKLLTVFVALLVVVSLFAAEKPFTLGPNVKYAGSVSFSLVVTADGADISGSLTVDSAELPFGPKSDTQAGATFDITYSPFGGVGLTLKSITFSTPYFGAFYSTGKQFVSDYFTGKNYSASGSPFTTAMADFADSLKLTFPAVQGLELYMLDKTSEGTVTWFDDMLLAKYTISGWTVVGGLYNVKDTNTHEFGAAVNGSIGLGVVTPTVTVFAGMVASSTMVPMVASSTMVPAVDVNVSANLTMAGLTLEPKFKYGENLDRLEYKSSNIVNGKFVQLGVKYVLTVAPVTLTAQITPKYDFAPATPTFTLPLNELSAKVEVTPVTLLVKTTNADVLDKNKKYTLYTEASYKDAMLSASAKAEWADITELATYTYIHLNGSVNATPDLTLEGNFRMVTTGDDKMGYNAMFTYKFTPNVSFTGFYGTLTKDADGNYTVINAKPTWNLKLSYSATF